MQRSKRSKCYFQNMNFNDFNDFDVDEECNKIMSLSPDMYSKKDYWDQRYTVDVQNNKKFEWYHPWSFFVPYVSKFIKCQGNVLNIGAGNSTLSVDLLKYGSNCVFNVDISDVVINYMKKEYINNKGLEWIVGDCRKLSFEDNFFDFAIDKGTYDAILCSSDGSKNVKSMFKEICRTMKPGSQFLEIATSSKEDIIKYLSKPYLNWHIIQVITINDASNTIYVYILEKEK